jgi:hypothetical protein
MLNQSELDEIANRNRKLKQLKARWQQFSLSVPVAIGNVPDADIDKLLEEIGNLKFTISIMDKLLVNRKSLPLHEFHGGLGDK